jgi:hypothetical protein
MENVFIVAVKSTGFGVEQEARSKGQRAKSEERGLTKNEQQSTSNQNLKYNLKTFNFNYK